MTIRKVLVSALLGATMLALTGCVSESRAPKHMKPIASKTLALMQEKGMTRRDPIVVRIFKEESQLEIWKRDSSGRYAHFKSYDICAWSGVLGPKKKEGDRQAPEGFYSITPGLMNPNSNYYLSFNIGYPNQFDKSYDRTGSHLMVHGACSSRGCYSMTDEQMGEIYALAREAFKGGQRSFQVQALPFRMTPENLARHRNNPHMEFWKNLKKGSDHFEVTGLPPEVDVCGRQYVFNAKPESDRAKLVPARACPKLVVPENIQVAVAEKEKADEAATEVAIAALLSNPASGVATPSAPNTMIASDPRERSVTVASASPVVVPGAPEIEEEPKPVQVAAAEPQDERGSFFSRMVAAAKPSSWGKDETEATPVALSEVPLPTRPQRSASTDSRMTTGYAPIRDITPGDGDPFEIFELFQQVGKAAWMPKDSLAVRAGNR